MFRPIIPSVLLLALLAGAPAVSADVTETMTMCDGCHGTAGISEWNDVPTIAGLAEFVHSDALFTYRDNARPCAETKFRQGDTSRPETSMCKVAQGLSDNEIEEIATIYSELAFFPAKQDFDSSLVETGKAVHDQHCDRCHSDAGMNPEDEAGMLGGQWSGYLATSMVEFAAGERPQPEKMQEKIALLSDADVQALLSYYASQQ